MLLVLALLQLKKTISNEFKEGYHYDLQYIDSARNNLQWNEHFHHGKYHFGPTVLPNELNIIEYTSFAHIYTATGFGAITSFGPLTLKNTFFFNCIAKYGSAIKSSNKLSVEQCSFSKCQSIHKAGVIYQSHPFSSLDLIIKESTTEKSSARIASILYRKSNGQAGIFNSNFSNSQSSDEIGGFCLSLGTIEVADTHFINVSSVINGCFSIENSALFRMHESVFLNASEVSKRRGTSSCVTISNVTFIRFYKIIFCDSVDGRTTLCVNECRFGTIVDSKFSKSKVVAISAPLYIDINGTTFNCNCEIAITKKSIGYRSDNFYFIAKTMDHFKFKASNVLLAFLIAMFATYLIILMRNRAKRKYKLRSGESYTML